MGENSTEKASRSAYDTVKGGLMGLSIDTHSKGYLVRNLDYLYEQYLTLIDQIVALSATASRSSQTSTIQSSGSVSGVDDTTESGETYDKERQ